MDFRDTEIWALSSSDRLWERFTKDGRTAFPLSGDDIARLKAGHRA